MDYPQGERAIADCWVLTTANAVGTNDLTCFTKHGGVRDNKSLVIHPKTEQHCLAFAIARRAHYCGTGYVRNKLNIQIIVQLLLYNDNFNRFIILILLLIARKSS
jgi:hypothetical protein